MRRYGKYLVIIYILMVLLAVSGCGDDCSTAPLSSGEPAYALTPAQIEFIKNSRSEYSKNPRSTSAIFNMAVASGLEYVMQDNNIYRISGGFSKIFPSTPVLLKLFFGGKTAFDISSVSQWLDSSIAAVKNAIETRTPEIEKAQDSIVDVAVPFINKEIEYLKGCQSDDFKYTLTPAGAAAALNIAIPSADGSVSVVLTRGDMHLLEFCLLTARGVLYYICAFNLNPEYVPASNSYNYANVLKLRENQSLTGKGALRLKLARESLAAGLDAASSAVDYLEGSALSSLSGAQKLDAVRKIALKLQLNEIKKALMAGAAYELKLPFISASASIKFDLAALERTPEKTDIKAFINAIYSAYSGAPGNHDYTLNGLFPELLTADEVKNKFAAFNFPELKDLLTKWKTMIEQVLK